jgi:hypothetical protein
MDDTRDRVVVVSAAELCGAPHLAGPAPVCEVCRVAAAVKTGSDGLHECARCAVVLPAPSRGTAPAGRNHPCPCGSNKKYKRCCLKGAA